MHIDWNAVSAIASSAATVLATIGIFLAARAVRVANQSARIDRRRYLDEIFEDASLQVHKLFLASLAPTNTEDSRQRRAKSDTATTMTAEQAAAVEMEFWSCLRSLDRLSATGLGELDSSKDPTDPTLGPMIELLEGLAALTYNFALNYSDEQVLNSQKLNGWLWQTRESALKDIDELLVYSAPAGSPELALVHNLVNQTFAEGERVMRAKVLHVIHRDLLRAARERFGIVASLDAPWWSSRLKIRPRLRWSTQI